MATVGWLKILGNIVVIANDEHINIVRIVPQHTFGNLYTNSRFDGNISLFLVLTF